MARSLESIAKDLKRLADAAERLSPPYEVPAPGSAEVVDIDLAEQARYDIARMDYQHRHGRLPNDDELIEHYEQVKGLM